MTRAEFIRRLKSRGHNDEYIAAVAGPAIDDPVYRHLQEQDEYWRKQGGREQDTSGVSFRERREVVNERLEREKTK